MNTSRLLPTLDLDDAPRAHATTEPESIPSAGQVGHASQLQRTILQMQRTHGNAAVQRMLAARGFQVQRLESGHHSTRTDGPTPDADSAGGPPKYTEEEWVSMMSGEQVAIQNPMIMFRLGESMWAKPAKVYSGGG